jgi:DNA-binding protein H-NS
MATDPKKTVPRTALLKKLQELEAQRIQIEAELEASRIAELKGLADAFKKQLADNKFDMSEALKHLGVKKTRAKRGTGLAKSVKSYEVGVTYKNPKGDATWVGGTKGPQPKWLKDLLAGGKTFQSLTTKK